MRKKFFSTFVLIFLITFSFCIVCYLVFSNNIESKTKQASEGSIQLDNGWFNKENETINNISRLDKADDSSSESEASVFHVLPQEIPENSSLCFRAKHIYYSVYADGNLLYKQTLPESKFYTNSDGAVWAFVPIDASYAGKTVEIRYQLCYPKSAAGIDSVYLGSERGYLLKTLSSKLFAVGISLFLIIMSFLFIACEIPFLFVKSKNRELFFLGIMTLVIGVFCFTETQTVQLFIGNERIMHLLSCITLFMLPVPIILYADEAFGLRYKNSALIFTLLWAVIYSAFALLNYFDIADYHDVLTMIHIIDLASVGILLHSIILYFKRNKKMILKSKYSILCIIGLIALSAGGIIDFMRYYRFPNSDPAFYIRIGVLVFIISFGAASLQKSIDSVESGIKADLIRKLAYSDGLTGIGNRTAYQEKIDNIRGSGEKVGIVMFDVNNLKKVNDKLGHELGDKMLKQSALFIEKIFHDCLSDCYRIGGDEFVVIIHSEDSFNIYQEARKKLDSLCDEHNSLPDKEYPISIASGFACINSETTSIEDVCKLADSNMYENKFYMKELMKVNKA